MSPILFGQQVSMFQMVESHIFGMLHVEHSSTASRKRFYVRNIYIQYILLIINYNIFYLCNILDLCALDANSIEGISGHDDISECLGFTGISSFSDHLLSGATTFRGGHTGSTNRRKRTTAYKKNAKRAS